MARQKKKALKAREQLFDRSGAEQKGGGRGGGADSDSEDEDKDGGVWAENEKEAMMGPGDEAKSSAEAEREARKAITKMGTGGGFEGGGKRSRT
ncbi:unnamed protein product [Scytosiphon promiscuus]